MRNLNFLSKFFILNFWSSQCLRLLRPCIKWRGQKKLKSMSFHQYLWNSEVETNWISLIGWLHKTSNIHTYLPILEGRKCSFESCLLVDRFEDLMFQKFVSREDLALSTLWNGKDLIVERQRGNSSLIWHGRLRNTSNLNFSASQWGEIIYVVAIKYFSTCVFTSYFLNFAII